MDRDRLVAAALLALGLGGCGSSGDAGRPPARAPVSPTSVRPSTSGAAAPEVAAADAEPSVDDDVGTSGGEASCGAGSCGAEASCGAHSCGAEPSCGAASCGAGSCGG